MAAPPPDPPPDQTATQWRDDAWLRQWPLTRATALDYFSGSPFYDRACANEAARAQGLAPDQLALMPAGPEYVLVSSEEPFLFVIARRWRGAPGAPPTPQALYYILEGAVYQAPSVGAVLAARLDRCLWSIKAAFARMAADLDPLAAGEKRALAAAAAAEAAAVSAAGGNDAPATTTATAHPALPPLPPPPRRYTDVERARMATADRVVALVLRGLDDQARKGVDGPGGGGGVPPPPFLGGGGGEGGDAAMAEIAQ